MSFQCKNSLSFGVVALGCAAIALTSTAISESGSEDYEVVWIENPETGVLLHARLRYPVDFDRKQTYPAIILVPGGSGDGMSFETGGEAAALADHGFFTMSFSPDGRGQSTNGGTYTDEDYCGFLQQAGLREVVQYVYDMSETDDSNIGVLSRSYGITLAAGALGRYPNDPPVKFLIEWEGPADRSDTASPNGHVPHDISDDEWWVEREPTEHIGGFPGYVQIVQKEQDHVQSDNLHSIKINNEAVGPAGDGPGSAVWVRVNDGSGPAGNPINTVYQPPIEPAWHSNSSNINAILRGYALEMAAMDVLSIEGDLNGDLLVDGADLAVLLGSWGYCPECPADINGDDFVDGADLAQLLGSWTP